ncbi:hypothetical protein HID58_061917, partial [Brassica napus]
WSLEELSLRSYDAVEIEPGLLATLGQHLGRLRKPEFSFNELLFDKEVVSILRGCKNLTGSVLLVSLNKSCVKLRNLDIADEVEAFVHKSQCLKKILVEENKITEAAPKWASIVALDSDVHW